MPARATKPVLGAQRVQLVEAAELETLGTRGGGEVPADAVLPPAGVGKAAWYCGFVHRDGLFFQRGFVDSIKSVEERWWQTSIRSIGGCSPNVFLYRKKVC